MWAGSPRGTSEAATRENIAPSTSEETNWKSPGVLRVSSMTRTGLRILALIHYVDGEKRYIIAPLKLQVGDTVVASRKPDAEIKEGNCLLLKLIPLGTFVHNVEMKPGKGGQMARSAGNYAQVVAKEGDYGHLRLPSGEVKLINLACTATIGQVGNIEHENIEWGKAGRSRWRGVRPTVRGTAMNPVDHPLGGGEGRSKGGRHPCSPWGQLCQGSEDEEKQENRQVHRKEEGLGGFPCQGL